MSVMALQGRKSSPQKSRPLESGNRSHAVWIAIEYSYKLGQKNEFKFWCELGWFLQRQSQIFSIIIVYYSNKTVSELSALPIDNTFHFQSLKLKILTLQYTTLIKQSVRF